jgi:hypothetical protein
MTTLLPYQTTELSDEIAPCEKSRLDLRFGTHISAAVLEPFHSH